MSDVRFTSILNNNSLIGKFNRMLPADIDKVLNTQAIITEKIHGENFRIGMTADGNIFIGQKNNLFRNLKDHPHYHKFSDILLDQIHKLFGHFLAANTLKTLEKNEDTFTEIIGFGELYGPGMQKGFTWNFEGLRVLWFDLKQGGVYVPSDTLKPFYDILELNTVPLIGVMSIKEALQLDIETIKSQAANEDYIEGIVINPLTTPDCWRFPARLIIKHKTKKYTENHSGKWRHQKEVHGEVFVSKFLDFVTDERIQHAMQTITESGQEIFYEMQDLKFLTKEVLADIEKEEHEGLRLPKDDRKYLSKYVPKYYRNYLARMVEEKLKNV